MITQVNIGMPSQEEYRQETSVREEVAQVMLIAEDINELFEQEYARMKRTFEQDHPPSFYNKLMGLRFEKMYPKSMCKNIFITGVSKGLNKDVRDRLLRYLD